METLRKQSKFFLIIFIEWIIIYHSLGYTAVSQKNLVRICSVLTLFNWLRIFDMMQLFNNTAVYVRLLIQTISNVTYFLIIYAILIACFGNVVAIIELYDYNQSLDPPTADYQYVSLFENAFDSIVLNSFINQYLLGLGEFSNDYFESNNSYVFLWIYFLLATLFTQIIFFNMIISIMGTSFEEVMANKDRSSLIQHTIELQKHIYSLNENKKLN